MNFYLIHGIAKHRPFSEIAIASASFLIAMLVSPAIVHAILARSFWLSSALPG